ncbi:hypothetical protein [Microbulbifer spongiae]|uniref:Uncharacterized protein n=1 Tax=Microbulbifer spongiae TaxID=2944933 RepID=A0ABY9EAV8_9GAMM|nr:hypothetical protein [Microbulbifer sp. MI-G]WKD49600.1 hypothetical protein M8T91_17185 [Microbulbifer sp. MI-G]
MIPKIAIFYLIVFITLITLRWMRPNIVTLAAFSWFGPFPEEGELLSSFKAKRIRYAFGWIVQFAAYFSLLTILGVYFKSYFSETFFLVASFAGIIGGGMALLACIGFSVSWLKTIIIGPNPKCERLAEYEI